MPAQHLPRAAQHQARGQLSKGPAHAAACVLLQQGQCLFPVSGGLETGQRLAKGAASLMPPAQAAADAGLIGLVQSAHLLTHIPGEGRVQTPALLRLPQRCALAAQLPHQRNAVAAAPEERRVLIGKVHGCGQVPEQFPASLRQRPVEFRHQRCHVRLRGLAAANAVQINQVVHRRPAPGVLVHLLRLRPGEPDAALPQPGLRLCRGQEEVLRFDAEQRTVEQQRRVAGQSRVPAREQRHRVFPVQRGQKRPQKGVVRLIIRPVLIILQHQHHASGQLCRGGVRREGRGGPQSGRQCRRCGGALRAAERHGALPLPLYVRLYHGGFSVTQRRNQGREREFRRTGHFFCQFLRVAALSVSLHEARLLLFQADCALYHHFHADMVPHAAAGVKGNRLTGCDKFDKIKGDFPRSVIP